MQIDYPINELPIWVITSSAFQEFRKLYPDEVSFPFLDWKIEKASNISVESYNDINRIIVADLIFEYSEETRIEILKNVDKFWNENPNSSPVILPEKSTSWFGLQIRELLSTPSSDIIINCMKLNYVELFKFQIQTSKSALADAEASASLFTLLYYAVANNNVEILEAGIKAGCHMARDVLLKKALENKSFECMKLILDNMKKNYVFHNLHNFVAKNGSLKQLIYFLEWCENNGAISIFKNMFEIKQIIENIENFKYLCENKYSKFDNPYKILFNALRESLPIESIRELEEFLGIKVSSLLEKISEFNDIYLIATSIKKNNIELYNYLRESGYKVKEYDVEFTSQYKFSNFSVGLVKAHFKEDNPKL